METKQKEGIRKKKETQICLLLLALLLLTTPATAQNTTALTYLTRPADVTVAVGESAVFRCGVSEASPNLTFTIYKGDSNYTLTCPYDHLEDIPEALYGSCEVKDGQSLGVWSIKGTCFADNGTRVVCQQLNNPAEMAAVLLVYDNGLTKAILIGCVIGGFFGTLLVAVLLYLTLQRSKTLQNLFSGGQTEDDMFSIVKE